MNHTQQALRVFELEANAISDLKQQLDASFDLAIDTILASQGKLVVTGMGKSGLIGKKIAATLASTGTPSFFLHPAEAWHGDLGMVGKDDILLAISNSGESEELIGLIPFMQANKNTLIAMTGNLDSTLARNADFHLSIAVAEEACPLRLAPTSSTTATAAMGDAVAMALMVARDFQPSDFARFHPGGSLGRRLLTRVRDVMRGEQLPILAPTASTKEVIQVATEGRLGVAIVMDGDELRGIITDGDIRRAIEKYEDSFLRQTAADVMTVGPRVISPSARLQEAADTMHELNITVLLVVENERLEGVLQLYQCEL
ncbi:MULTISPECIES: KpsF/GutQ family sugar-phosphate isomerase [Corallincola]|uniref:Arabinose 5-phosphate isomerase n=3 Tax=Corallincola TaxID=1775176 RepID=A0A368N777_9GAMM|nr:MULTISPECIES: KpsF/GutQ family sugar-phosphate isomerase [Corallincola]RCU45129.1 KpsF/GutQ family sugar-phosphate isomerase [Corallincola holothuriorum]TAA46825.1 KpsF/GutQ family sugar-phosphate isomerase [Corallincola spongiicola]TCI04471.1 KpsF/GutQ family sugar-phosphate isomerase [Corallincola luteus]